MNNSFAIAFVAFMLVSLVVQRSFQLSECEKSRQTAESQLKQNRPVLVPNCNSDGSYAALQCHHNSPFCQCWDREGKPMTQPKKNLKKCSCMVERTTTMNKLPPSRTDAPELPSCDADGSYTAKQCNRAACWCVDPDTGTKIGKENSNKDKVKC